MSLSKRNRRGVIGLVVFGAALMFVPRVLAYFDDEVVYKVTLEDIATFENEVANSAHKKRKSYKKNTKHKEYKSPSKAFDPNDYSSEDWQKLGLSAKQAQVIKRFTERRIYSNEELKKIFVLPNELFILIKDSTFYKKKEIESPERRKKETVINLNSASKEDLLSLKGIGPYYADKIVVYRSELGGFVNDLQLLEIWKFNEEKLDGIRSDIAITKEEIVQLNINTVSIDELRKHPYISYSVANSIVKMRTTNGQYKHVSDIKRSRLIDEELYEKIKDYLTTD